MEAAFTRIEYVEAAQQMIERFGSDAIGQINQRISELEELREADAVRFWRDVMTIVKAILQTNDCQPIN